STFTMGNFERGILELPRELPGLLVIFVSALLAFLCPRHLAVTANALTGLGMFLIAFFSSSFNTMLLWLFIGSVGQHLFFPLQSSIAMELAPEGHTGRVLGRLQSWGNMAGLAGSLVVWGGFRLAGFDFTTSFVIGGCGFFFAALMIALMSRDQPHPASSRFRLRREYGLFYWLTVLYGTRKQLFLTFAPWVLVTIFKEPTETIAILLFIGGVIGIFFKPWLGHLIDTRGERFVFTVEAILLIVICLGYAFASDLFIPSVALVLTAICYVVDQLLVSAGMARATWLKKIALAPEDVQQTLTMGVSIDHVFSISIALIGGLLWHELGHSAVFLVGAGIAVVNLISARFVRVPGHKKTAP
ncbi:MAG TPA: MFS transporter, partial [Spirochaetota bacterium]|nr:MFS transporter [Spirochaetota bacterium]